MNTPKRKQAAAVTEGSAFVALVRLSTKQNETLAMPGERCDRVPASSLPHLLAHDPRQIVPAAAFDALTADRQAWLIAQAGANAGWRDRGPEDEHGAWLHAAGLITGEVAEG